MAVDFCQRGSTLHLPVRRLEARGRKVSEMFDPLTNATGKCFLSLEHSITETHEMCNKMKPAALVKNSLMKKGDIICPVKSMGLSNLGRMSELEGCVFELFHVETSTDGVEVVSLIRKPGRKATVLAHSDFSVDGPGVQATSRGPDLALNRPHE